RLILLAKPATTKSLANKTQRSPRSLDPLARVVNRYIRCRMSGAEVLQGFLRFASDDPPDVLDSRLAVSYAFCHQASRPNSRMARFSRFVAAVGPRRRRVTNWRPSNRL